MPGKVVKKQVPVVNSIMTEKFHKNGNYVTVYFCDPDKHKDCKSANMPNYCGIECFSTKHEEYAKTVEVEEEE
jgi:hypothetical protein